MRQLILKILLIGGDLIGFNYIFRKVYRRKIRIVMYHGISRRELPTFYWTNLSYDDFARQIEHITRHYRPVPAETVLKDSEDSADDNCRAIVTFDDGLANVYDNAWPILKQNGIRAICFVLPKLSESGRYMWPDELYDIILESKHQVIDLSQFGLGKITLENDSHHRFEIYADLKYKLKSWPHKKRTELLDFLVSRYQTEKRGEYAQFRLMTPDQIKEIEKSGNFDIGAHTSEHPILSTLPIEEQEKQIKQSYDDLIRWGIKPPPIFAYPNGRRSDFNSDTIEVLKKMGFKASFSTIDGLHDIRDDKFHLKRIPVGANMSFAEFKARMSGYYYFVTSLAGQGEKKYSGKDDVD